MEEAFNLLGKPLPAAEAVRKAHEWPPVAKACAATQFDSSPPFRRSRKLKRIGGPAARARIVPKAAATLAAARAVVPWAAAAVVTVG